MPADVLAPGTFVQYRRVGLARLVRRDPSCDARPGNAGWWEVEWLKAPRRYREALGAGTGNVFWLDPGDLVPTAACPVCDHVKPLALRCSTPGCAR